LDWNAPAATITTKCNSFTRGRFAHPLENRNITMREAARLQSFPDSFEFIGDRVSVAHQIGNAVPPLLAEAVGAAVRRGLLSPQHEFAGKSEPGLRQLELGV
jgi:DNA (cytosine-5)-methyltransferase 1